MDWDELILMNFEILLFETNVYWIYKLYTNKCVSGFCPSVRPPVRTSACPLVRPSARPPAVRQSQIRSSPF